MRLLTLQTLEDTRVQSSSSEEDPETQRDARTAVMEVFWVCLLEMVCFTTVLRHLEVIVVTPLIAVVP